MLGLMVVPIIASISDDAMRAVPNGLREGVQKLAAVPSIVFGILGLA